MARKVSSTDEDSAHVAAAAGCLGNPCGGGGGGTWTTAASGSGGNIKGQRPKRARVCVQERQGGGPGGGRGGGGGADVDRGLHELTQGTHPSTPTHACTNAKPSCVQASFQNQFIGGSLVLSITGGIMALVYGLYVEVQVFVTNWMYVTVEVPKSQEIYHWLTNWLVNHEVVQRSSHFSATTNAVPGDGDRDYYGTSYDTAATTTLHARKVAKVTFLPVGLKATYKVIYKNTIVWVSVECENEMGTRQSGIFHGSGIHGRSGVPDNRGYVLRTFNMNGKGRELVHTLIVSFFVFVFCFFVPPKLSTNYYFTLFLFYYSKTRRQSTTSAPSTRSRCLSHGTAHGNASAAGPDASSPR